MANRTIRSVYFTRLALENVRSFSERQELKLIGNEGRPAQWTLILGDNGVGKTTLLECLARMRPVLNPSSNENDDQTIDCFEPEFKGEESNDTLDTYARSGPNTIAKLKAELSYGVPFIEEEACSKPESCKGSISTWLEIARRHGQLERFSADGDETISDVDEPFVLAYGAGRHPKTNGLEQTETAGPVSSLFKVESALRDAESLLSLLEFATLKGNEQAKGQRDALKRMLAEILPDLECSQNIEIHGPSISSTTSKANGVWVLTDYGKVPLSRLSLGYQTVVAWTLDIAWRLLERYPDSDDPMREAAIVIVDEIDLHLHPRWQRTIRQHLTEHFPNIQFIATAHSPLMAQSSLDGNLAVLRKHEDHTEILNDPTVIKEWRIDQVITSELFGLESARPPEVEKALTRRHELTLQEKLSANEQRELAELDRIADSLPSAETEDDRNAMAIIRRAAEALTRGESAERKDGRT